MKLIGIHPRHRRGTPKTSRGVRNIWAMPWLFKKGEVTLRPTGSVQVREYYLESGELLLSSNISGGRLKPLNFFTSLDVAHLHAR